MADAPQTAIRVGDSLLHSESKGWAIAGIVGGIAAGLLVGALIVGTGGLAGVAMAAGVAALGGGAVATLSSAAFIIGAGLVGGALGGSAGKIHGSHQTQVHGKVLTGSPNVFIGYDKQPAARAEADVGHCDQHSDSEPALEQPGIRGHRIMQGSEHVLINGHYAARQGDKGTCDFTLGDGWPTVIIGGLPKTVAGMKGISETASIDGLIFGMGIVGGVLMMVPAAVAAVGAGTIAGVTGAALYTQAGLRVAAQFALGVGLSAGGGLGAHWAGAQIGLKEGSESLEMLTLGGEVAAPFAGMVKIPGAGRSLYGMVDAVPFYRGRPGGAAEGGVGEGAAGKGASEPPTPPKLSDPLTPNQPHLPEPAPAPEVAAPETTAPEAGEGTSAPKPTEPTPAHEPEAARTEPEPAPRTNAPKTRETGLSDRATQAIEKLENIKADPIGEINSEPNHNHYSAARQEAMGKVVARKSDGTPFDHIGDLQRASRALDNVRGALEAEMRNPPEGLTERGFDVLQQRYSEVQTMQSRLKGFLGKIGQGQFPPFHTWPPGS